MRPRLRLFGDTPFDDDPSIGSERVAPPTVMIPLKDVVRLLREAVASDHVWLEDFGDEDIQVSEDLYAVLRAYEQMRSAA